MSCPNHTRTPSICTKHLSLQTLPSTTHQARIPLGFTDLGAELLQFQLVDLQVGPVDSSTAGSDRDLSPHHPAPQTPWGTPIPTPSSPSTYVRPFLSASYTSSRRLG